MCVRVCTGGGGGRGKGSCGRLAERIDGRRRPESAHYCGEHIRRRRVSAQRGGMYYCRGGGHVPSGGREGQGADTLEPCGRVQARKEPRGRRRACASEQRTVRNSSMCVVVGSPWRTAQLTDRHTCAAGPSHLLCLCAVLYSSIVREVSRRRASAPPPYRLTVRLSERPNPKGKANPNRKPKQC